MSNLLNSENHIKATSNNNRRMKKCSIITGCLAISLGIMGLSATLAIANLAKEKIIRTELQSINTFTAFKNGKISYETFEYISEGRGQAPSSLESLMLMSVQKERGNFSGRDRTLMRALKGDNSIEIYQVLGSAREIYDEKYRNDNNALNKKIMSEKLYNKTIELQKTTLNEDELKALKKCSEKLIGKQGELNMFMEMLLPRQQQCPEATEIATKFLDRQKDSNNNPPTLRQLQ